MQLRNEGAVLPTMGTNQLQIVTDLEGQFARDASLRVSSQLQLVEVGRNSHDATGN